MAYIQSTCKTSGRECKELGAKIHCILRRREWESRGRLDGLDGQTCSARRTSSATRLLVSLVSLVRILLFLLLFFFRVSQHISRQHGNADSHGSSGRAGYLPACIGSINDCTTQLREHRLLTRLAGTPKWEGYPFSDQPPCLQVALSICWQLASVNSMQCLAW